MKEKFTEAPYKNHEMSKPTCVQARQKDTRVFKYKVHCIVCTELVEAIHHVAVWKSVTYSKYIHTTFTHSKEHLQQHQTS